MAGLPIQPVEADDQIAGAIFAFVHLVYSHDLASPLVLPLVIEAGDHHWITRSRETLFLAHRRE